MLYMTGQSNTYLHLVFVSMQATSVTECRLSTLTQEDLGLRIRYKGIKMLAPITFMSKGRENETPNVKSPFGHMHFISTIFLPHFLMLGMCTKKLLQY